jgi:hypothetical protein
MNGNGPRPTPRTLEEWLRSAYEGCPPPEAFLEEETAALDPAARRRLDEHVERCPACAAERELAQLFDAGPEAAGVRPEDVSFVVAQLAAASPLGPQAEPAPASGRVIPFAPAPSGRSQLSPRSRRSPWPARLAAAAVVILAAGLFLQRQLAPPSLPAPPVAGVLRGGVVEPLAPVGEVASVPVELAWEPRPGAAAYRVRLRTFDDELLWEETVAAPPARLPAAVAGRLTPAVAYFWSVEALDAKGARLAGSEAVRFQVRPAGEGGGHKGS